MAYKIVLLGDSGVGKSCLLKTVDGSALHSHDMDSTIGMDLKVMKLCIDGKETKLHLWDTAGQERHRSMCPQYIRNADGAVVVYDVTRKKSFESVNEWVKVGRVHAKDVDVIIVGNKIDQENRQVTRRDGLQLAEEQKSLFLETSAFSGDGINPVLEKLVRKMLPRPTHPKPVDTVRLSDHTYDQAVNKERGFLERCC